jgi:hypothetical protein
MFFVATTQQHIIFWLRVPQPPKNKELLQRKTKTHAKKTTQSYIYIIHIIKQPLKTLHSKAKAIL